MAIQNEKRAIANDLVYKVKLPSSMVTVTPLTASPSSLTDMWTTITGK
ncbi:MAG: hypothetical protein IPK21_22850 [Haliscomenobacter sp.]|nr:hypothetical protein [Haliscomenobacter sp.]